MSEGCLTLASIGFAGQTARGNIANAPVQIQLCQSHGRKPVHWFWCRQFYECAAEQKTKSNMLNAPTHILLCGHHGQMMCTDTCVLSQFLCLLAQRSWCGYVKPPADHWLPIDTPHLLFSAMACTIQDFQHIASSFRPKSSIMVAPFGPFRPSFAV